MLDVREESGVVILTFTKERLDASVAGDFKEKFNSQMRDQEQKYVLDLSRVSFIDSTGLGAIVACLKAVTGNGTLVLAGVHGAAQDLFKLTRLNSVFRMFDSVDEALA